MSHPDDCEKQAFSCLVGCFACCILGPLLLGAPVIAVVLVFVACRRADMLNVGILHPQGYPLDSAVFDDSPHPQIATALQWIGCVFVVIAYSLFVTRYKLATRQCLAYLLLVTQLVLLALLLFREPPYCANRNVVCDLDLPRGKILLLVALIPYVVSFCVVGAARPGVGAEEQEEEEQQRDETRANRSSSSSSNKTHHKDENQQNDELHTKEEPPQQHVHQGKDLEGGMELVSQTTSQ